MFSMRMQAGIFCVRLVAPQKLQQVIPLQHVQHQIYFCNIQMKRLQHTFATVETLATYI
jgi:hypothetical protein